LNNQQLHDVKGLLEFEINYGKTPENLSQTIKRKLEFDLSLRVDESKKPTAQIGISARDR
jgi:hypothetical protein